MLKILQISDNIDNSLRLDPAHLTGDAVEDMKSTYAMGFKAGMAVTIGADGYIAVATADSVMGLLVNDVAGASFENTPAIASGIAPAITGGLVHTDMVIGDVLVGDKVYVAAGGKVSAAPAVAGDASFGLVTEGNVVTNGPITYRFSASF